MNKAVLHIHLRDGVLVGEPVHVDASEASPPASTATVGSGTKTVKATPPLADWKPVTDLARQSSDVSDPGKAQRQAKILDAVGEWLAGHSGCSFKTAYLTIQHERPELFPEGERPETQAVAVSNQEKVDVIKTAIAKMREERPTMSFSQAWHRLMQTNPEMFAFTEH